MALTLSNVAAEIGWTQSTSITGFQPRRQGNDKLQASLSPDVTVFNELFAVQGTLTASSNTTIDLYSITNLLGEAKTLTKGIAIMLTATTTGMKYEPGATNPLTWFLSGTTPAISVQAGGFFIVGDGSVTTLSATVRNIKITNLSGSTTGTYRIAFLGGT